MPKYGWAKGGEGFGRSIRYDIRHYPEPVAEVEKTGAEKFLEFLKKSYAEEMLKKSEMPALEFLKSPFAPFFMKSLGLE